MGVAQVIKGIEPLFEGLSQFLQWPFKTERAQQIDEGENAAGFNAEAVNGFFGKSILAAGEALAIAAAGFADAAGQMLGQLGWKGWVHIGIQASAGSAKKTSESWGIDAGLKRPLKDFDRGEFFAFAGMRPGSIGCA